MAKPGHQSAPPLQIAGQYGLQKNMRRAEFGARQQIAQGLDRLGKLWLFPQMPPQGPAPRLSRAIGSGQQLVLCPSDQRGDQQFGQIEIVLRLHGKADSREQVLHRQRLAEPQPVHAGHRHAFCIQPGHQQRCQLGPAPDEDHDIARCQRLARGGQNALFCQPVLDLPRQFPGIVQLFFGQPAFLILVRGRLIDRANRLKQQHLPHIGFHANMRRHRLLKAEGPMLPFRHQRIDKFQDRFGRSEGGIEVQTGQGARLHPIQFGIGERRFDPLMEPFARRTILFGIGALKAEDRLFEIAHGKQRAHAPRSRAETREEVLGHRFDDIPLRTVGILRFVHQNMVDPRIEFEPDPVSNAWLAKQGCGAADQIVEIDDRSAALGQRIGFGIGTACR